MIRQTHRRMIGLGIAGALGWFNLAGSVGSGGYSRDGTATDASFTQPTVLTWDGNGNGYVGDASAIRKVAPGGVVTTVAATVGKVEEIDGLAADASGDLCVSYPSGTVTECSAAGAMTTLASGMGVYTAQVSSSNAASGVALVELYEVSSPP
jgi:hypothetical protein